jgi:hypothetical protein
MYDETKNQRDIIITQNDEPMLISVDCCIADLIIKLNNHGFYTEYCCSGHEEDAFMSMYIKFNPIDFKHESLIRTFINNYIDELYIEDDYEIGITSADISSNYVQLTDPTPEEMQMALKIVFRDRINDEELVNQDTRHNITIRAKCSRDYIKSHYNVPENWNEFIMTNKAKVMRGIKKLEFFINNLEILGCNPF